MGVHLAPLIRKQIVNLQNLRGHSFAVDGNNVLYQFLALIRLPDGKPLTSQTGKVTSHLVGLLFRTTRLISDYDMSLVFTFDGRPHERKREELRTRRATRLKAAKEYAEAVERRDYATAWSKAVASSRLTQDLVMDAQRLLDLLGIPWVQALGEGEAQAAFICSRGEVWASATRDYDSLLYGSPRLLRYLTISGREFLPSKGTPRPLEPELIRLDDFLGTLQLTQEQLIDLAIIVGTDYNRGVRGIGPHKALNLLQQYGCLENLPSELTDRLPSDFAAIRDLFLHPAVTKDYHIQPGGIDRDGLMEFLCEERGFSRRRVGKALGRLEKLRSHPSLAEFGDA